MSYLKNANTAGNADLVFGLGNPGDLPVAGDWDGLPAQVVPTNTPTRTPTAGPTPTNPPTPTGASLLLIFEQNDVPLPPFD